MISTVALFALVSAGILLRASLLLKYKWTGKDSFYHLMVGEIIQQDRALPKTIDRFVEPEVYSYPPLLHILISAFPRRLHRALQWLSPVSDGVMAFVLFAVCDPIFGDVPALLITGLYLFSPYAVDISFSFGPRSLANLLFFISFLSTYGAVVDGSLLCTAIAVISTSSVLLLHRLTTQSLLVTIIVLFIVSLSPIPLIILIASVALSVLLTGGFYVKVLKGHLSFIVELTRRIGREGFNPQLALPSPAFLLFNVPLLVLIIPALLWPVPGGSLYNAALVCSIGLVVLSVIWIWGEGMRHLSNAVPLLAIVAGVWTYGHSLAELAILLLVISAVVSVYKLRRIASMASMAMVLPRDVMTALDYIRTNSRPGEKVLSLPLDFTYATGYFTGLTMVQGSGGSAKGLCYNYTLHEAVRKKEFDALVLKFDVRWVIVYDLTVRLNMPHVVTSFGDKVAVLEMAEPSAH